MKLKLLIATFILTSIVACQDSGKVTKSDLKTDQDSISYSIGVDIGKNFRLQKIDITPEILLAGLKDAIKSDSGLVLTDAEMESVLMKFQEQMIAKQNQAKAEIAEKNKKEGDAFLAANKTKEGVKTTESGLQYRVITSGSGKSPLAESEVTVHYTGRLVDGTKFDSSVDRGEPATFPVNGVIPGWQEALKLMKEGDKWEVFIPSELGYGERGAGQAIAPNSVLIFEVELISVK